MITMGHKGAKEKLKGLLVSELLDSASRSVQEQSERSLRDGLRLPALPEMGAQHC